MRNHGFYRDLFVLSHTQNLAIEDLTCSSDAAINSRHENCLVASSISANEGVNTMKKKM